MGILGIGIGFEQVRVGQPRLNRFDAALKRSLVVVALRNHVLHQNDVGVQVFFDGFWVELHSATRCRALSRGI